jgi:hypothetical protein
MTNQVAGLLLLMLQIDAEEVGLCRTARTDVVVRDRPEDTSS